MEMRSRERRKAGSISKIGNTSSHGRRPRMSSSLRSLGKQGVPLLVLDQDTPAVQPVQVVLHDRLSEDINDKHRKLLPHPLRPMGVAFAQFVEH